MFEFQVKNIQGKEWKKIVASDEPQLIGRYKCECGSIIKNEDKLEQHLHTPSHQKKLDWRRIHLPERSILTGLPLFIK